MTCLFLTRPIPQHFTDFVNQVQLHVLDQGNYTEWTNWSECSATCGGGAQIRSRTCTNPPPKAGGKDCKETIGPAEESRQCDTGPCRKCCNFYFDEIVFKQLLTSNSFLFFFAHCLFSEIRLRRKKMKHAYDTLILTSVLSNNL